MTEQQTEEQPLTPAQIEGRLRSDFSGIASMWGEMFNPTAKRPRSGGGTGDGQTRLDDDSEAVADTPRTVLIIDIRREVLVTLRRWAEDTVNTIRARHKTAEDARRSLGRVPERNDAEALCKFLKRFAAHLAQHPEAELILEEIGDCWTAVNRVVHPFRKTWLSLGPCPLEYVDPADDVEKPCPGEVRSYGESHHGDSWATCNRCAAKAVARWWEGRMFGKDSTKPLTATEAVVWIHKAFGKAYARSTLFSWVKSRDLETSGKDDQGRTLFAREALANCIDRREKRRQGVSA